MRTYGRIFSQFWNNQDMRTASDRGKLAASYLLTCQHCNIIGAYLLPTAYLSDDLGWSHDAASKSIEELSRKGFCERFQDGRHIVICRYLRWNPIDNGNVGKAAIKQLLQLPDDPAVRHVVNGLKAYARHFPDGLEAVSKRFRTMEQELEREPDPDPEPEQDFARSAHADDEFALAVDAYNCVAKEFDWPLAQALTEPRRKKLAGRLREAGGIEGWRIAMEKARASRFLRGETGRDKAHAGWTPGFDFFLQQSSFTKLMEGRYDDRDCRAEPDGFAAVVAGARAAAH